MNSLFIVVAAGLIFLVAYRFYGQVLARLWQPDPRRPTPACSQSDHCDYVPSKNWLVLFGHHFASIAGAGPIIGPVIAVCLWGWVPALIWVIAGSILMGGIHDFGSLMISVRENGCTIGDIAAGCISQRAKSILSIFTWLALLLVIAVFAYLGADTFVTQPEIVLPSLGIIPVAVLTGCGLYRWRWPAWLVTFLGLGLLAALLIAGKFFPLVIGEGEAARNIWLILLLIYCYFASIIPVNYLLQPRDYLSSFLLIGGLLLALSGIFVSQPKMESPAFVSFNSPLGYLWPMMFITVACGANSGFHALIASGTTSKQLASEAHAQRIGFGAMLLEGFLAVLVIVLIAGGFTQEEFTSHIVAQTSPINMYGAGFGNITAPLLGTWGAFIALTILNIFILTTLDSATRITRYITEEFFRIRNRYLSTAIIVSAGGWLALGKTGDDTPLWQIIWPAFGASNQLVAALALLVISCWLLSKNQPTRYALIPAIFMLTTSLAALGVQICGYIREGNFLLTGISVILVAAAGSLTWETIQAFRKHRDRKERVAPKTL